jgi:hypothetical protein
MLWTGVIPLRAVAFQILFLLVAIALESFVLRTRLRLPRQQSMYYAVMINLLSTVVGWMVFFITEPWLPENLRSTLIGYVFFGIQDFPTGLAFCGFGIFVATFFLKVQGMELLDLVMEEVTVPSIPLQEIGKFRGRKRRYENFQKLPSRTIAVLWANACSFSAISLLIAIRYFLPR